MSSPVAELEAGLQAMLSLKPPGVSGSRIQNLTALCTANAQSESVLVQKLYTHFKKAPGTHKLGVLYVVDSVTRKWTELAKSAGQPINSAAQDGTYAAGVHRVKELLPVLMNDIAQSAPDDQKEKIKKLIDIWEKGQTFPLQMLTSFKDKLNAPSQNLSTTPPGSPPPSSLRAQPPTTTAPNTSSILAALANMARQHQQQPAAPPAATGVNQDSLYSMPNAQINPAQQVAAFNQSMPVSSVAPSVNVPGPGAAFASHLQGANGGVQNYASNLSNPYTAAPAIAPSAALNPAVQQQLVLIKTLSDAGVAPEQIAGIIASLGNQGGAAGGLPPTGQFPLQNQNSVAQPWGAARSDESRDVSAYPGNVRSPGQYRRRSRSPSPHRAWNARDSPSSRRRDDSGYDQGQGRDSPGDRGRGRAAGGRTNEYRQRSPPRRRSPTPPGTYGGGEKWIGHDASIGPGNIKVLSRTLFVGGVTCSEQELRSIFARLGDVQTCIVNREKRHAFVKMVSRADALAAKEAMERNKSDSQLRTRWGVGFGPRDCSDYQTGVSIIPITKLTDADRKWMVSAEFGGSGGKPIESGMVVEEPDIEIGQGVSSKAISRRMQTDKGGSNGPKSSRERDDDDGHRRRRGSRDEHRDDGRRKDDMYSANAPPSMPSIPPFGISNFPFQMPTLPNGMPMFPPGFVLPGQQQSQQSQPQQPPPPGHRT